MTRKEALAIFCNNTAEVLATSDGFVSVKSLIEKFGIRLILKPLLVEAVLASSSVENQPTSKPEWLIMVDNECYPYTEEDITNETPGSPLSARFRNTIAHELVHSLSFKIQNNNFELGPSLGKHRSKKDLIKWMEKQTEALSPLLLIPNSKLHALSGNRQLTIESLNLLINQCGISRAVLLNRLILLLQFDPSNIRYNSCLENTVIGRGIWLNGVAQLEGWPLFANFRGGYIPKFINSINFKEKTPICDVTTNPEFYLNGGDSLITDIDCTNETSFDYLKMKVRLTVEQTSRTENSRFLFIINRIS